MKIRKIFFIVNIIINILGSISQQISYGYNKTRLSFFKFQTITRKTAIRTLSELLSIFEHVDVCIFNKKKLDIQDLRILICTVYNY